MSTPPFTPEKVLMIQLGEGQCRACFLDSPESLPVADKQFLMRRHSTWMQLFTAVIGELNLYHFAPPMQPKECGPAPSKGLRVWQVVTCGTPQAPGWGWGFMLPCPAGEVPTETCCGFPTEEAAAKAAHALQIQRGRIMGEAFPNAVFEIFPLDSDYGFLDTRGEIHGTFRTHAEARGCAAKIEAQQTALPPNLSTSTTPQS